MTSWPRTGLYKGFEIGRLFPGLRSHHGWLPIAPSEFVEWHKAAVSEPFVGLTTDGNVRHGLYREEPTGLNTQPIVDAAITFLDCVDQLDYRLYVQQPFDSWHRRNWFNAAPITLPAGVLLEDLRPEQREAALAVVEKTLSPSGYLLVRKSMLINQAIGEIFNFYTDMFRELAVWFTIFGEPGLERPWGWQLMGTHIDINCTVVGDHVSLEPLFLGAEINEVDQGRYEGLNAYKPEEDAGLALGRTLSGAQRNRARIHPSMRAADLPPELAGPIDGRHIGGAGRDNQVVPYAGVCAADFSHEQRALLVDLIDLYASRLPVEHQRLRMADVTRFLDEVHVAYIGDPAKAPFYYRVHGPTIWIEFDHHPGLMLKDADDPIEYHVHTIMRAPNGGDYGMNLVELHANR